MPKLEQTKFEIKKIVDDNPSDKILISYQYTIDSYLDYLKETLANMSNSDLSHLADTKNFKGNIFGEIKNA